MEKIEIDGRKVNSKRDPPGQKCVYVTPGTVYICFIVKLQFFNCKAIKTA